jgi:hypothetical protein
MKKRTLIPTVIAAALLIGTSAYAQSPTPTPLKDTKCNTAQWDPQEYRLYGAKDSIIEKLANIPAKFSERRVFVEITQGDSSARVKLYERQQDGKFTVTEWAPQETSRLVAKIDEAIIANKGVNCVGEQMKGVLNKELEGVHSDVTPGVSPPASPQAAFAHPIKDTSGKFMVCSIFFGC